MPELTVEEWRFISVLLQNAINHERTLSFFTLADRHQATLEKIQPACEWDEDE